MMEKYKRAFIRHHQLIIKNREKRSSPYVNLDVFNTEKTIRNTFPTYPNWLKRYYERRTYFLRLKRSTDEEFKRRLKRALQSTDGRETDEEFKRRLKMALKSTGGGQTDEEFETRLKRVLKSTDGRQTDEEFKRRLKRALKSTGGSRTIGLAHRGGGSLNLRRNNKGRYDTEDDNDLGIDFDEDEKKEDEKQDEKQPEPKEDRRKNKKQRKNKKSKGPCDPLSTESYVDVRIVKHGRDPNVSFSSGTIVKVTCARGYSLTIPDNKTAKCVRGKWKPAKPECATRKFLRRIRRLS